MSVGKDVSSLFADVLNCMQSNSLEVKKLVYLYVINYAKSQPELAILAINTFRKDSLDPNPIIRALAVRTMGYIRLEAVLEYLMDPVRRCCRDTDPYVRKTAALCVAKLYSISPSMVEEQGLIEILQKELLSDSNPMVVANSTAAILEISTMCGRTRFDFSTPDTANSLLNALNECSEWGQSILLDAIALYSPHDAKEASTIIDRVSARLSHGNSSVVVGAVRIVMSLLDRLGSVELVRSTCRKLTAPLITMLAESSDPEIQYVALRNISLIMSKYPSVLSGEVKFFFCKYNDPVYVKLEKLEAIVQLVSERNADAVLTELKEYAGEVDVEFVRKAVRSIGRCAIRIESIADKCVSSLIELVETKVSYVVQEAVVVMRDIFRRFPNRYESVITALCDNLESLDQPEAKSAMIWILGEYADRIDNSGELIESFLNTFLDEPGEVQLQLLTTTVKYFLQVKGASHGTLLAVFKNATEKCENFDLRDRAYLYWRLLSIDPDLCRKVVLGTKPLIVDDSATIEPEIVRKLTNHVGTLSSMFHVDPDSFVFRSGGPIDVSDDLDTGGSAPKVVTSTTNSADTDTNSDGGTSSSSEESSSSSNSSEEDEETKTVQPTVPDLKTQKILVLPSTAQAGAKKTSGLQIDASIGKLGSMKRFMFMTITNKTTTALSQFAIQLNKNSFGISPVSSTINVGNGGVLNPNMAVEVSVPLDVNKLNSGQPPSGQSLSLQVAVKTNLDIFYFTVPFDLHVVLQGPNADGIIDQDDFVESWDALKSSQVVGTVSSAAPSSSNWTREKLVPRLVQGGFHWVDLGDSNIVSFSGITCNKLIVLVQFNIGLNKFAVRSSNVHLVTHCVNLVNALL